MDEAYKWRRIVFNYELEQDRKVNIKEFRAITDGESVLQQARIQTLMLDAMFSIVPPEAFKMVCERVVEIVKNSP